VLRFHLELGQAHCVGGAGYSYRMSLDHITLFPSPVGQIAVCGNDTAITSVNIERTDALPHGDQPECNNPLLERARTQLTEYFDGTRTTFDLPIVWQRGTPFQRAVWEQIAAIGWGEMTTYGEIAAAIGRPTASRAVGGAVGSNPIPIVVGCHRVLASDGRITGYSSGNGIPTKEWLLDHEHIRYSA